MEKPSVKLSLAQQMGLIAGILCFIVSIALVGLGTLSSKHMQAQQRDSHGLALARQIGRDAGNTLETGNLLGVAALLQRFVDSSAAVQAVMYGLDEKALAQAGNSKANARFYRAPVAIGDDIAGDVVVALDTTQDNSNLLRFALSLAGLALLLSLAAYLIARQLGQRHANQLRELYERIKLTGHRPSPDDNEWLLLKRGIDELPLDLLRARQSDDADEAHYQQTAVLFLQLDSLANYVDTLDQAALAHYTRHLHQIVYGAAGFYGGELQVVRQFGLAVLFSGSSSSGSVAFRAASCAWLIQELTREYAAQSPLGMTVFMAVSVSDVGAGNEDDIYPGLYTQAVIDDLQKLCSNRPPRVLLTPAAQSDDDISGRVTTLETDLDNNVMLSGFESPYDDLLERQLRLVWQQNLSAQSQR